MEAMDSLKIELADAVNNTELFPRRNTEELGSSSAVLNVLFTSHYTILQKHISILPCKETSIQSIVYNGNSHDQ